MDFSLTDQQKAWQVKAREFARQVIAPASLARDRIRDPRETFDWDIIRKGGELGFRTVALPREWGGHGVDLVTQALIITELARADSAISKTFSQCWKWSHLLASHCSDDQKNRFLPPFVSDQTYLLGHAGTEPNAGSDHRMPPEEDPKAGWHLRAERQGDEWILNGEKCFIANGAVAKLFFVSTRTNPNVRMQEGGTEFLVPIDTPGLRVGKVFNKNGWRFYQNAELVFENARVPHANVVGEVNEGYKTRGGGFGDLELSANALGICEAALEMAMEHGRTRWDGSRYFKENQKVQLMISEMHMSTEALRAFVMRVASESDVLAGKHTKNNVLLANFATDVVRRVTALNLEVHAAAGIYMMHPRADKLARDASIWTHLAGDSVQRMKVVRRMDWN